MLSMHLVLGGTFRVRHFERLSDEPDAIVIRPTVDRILRPGDATTVSDTRDNVHWHAAESRSVLLDCLVHDVDPRLGPTNTHLIDPLSATHLEGSRLRARRIDLERALAVHG